MFLATPQPNYRLDLCQPLGLHFAGNGYSHMPFTALLLQPTEVAAAAAEEEEREESGQKEVAGDRQ